MSRIYYILIVCGVFREYKIYFSEYSIFWHTTEYTVRIRRYILIRYILGIFGKYFRIYPEYVSSLEYDNILENIVKIHVFQNIKKDQKRSKKRSNATAPGRTVC